jgi:hypothetical protein
LRLGLRLHYLVIIVAFHAGLLALIWWGKGVIPRSMAPAPAAGPVTIQALPQRLLVESPPTADNSTPVDSQDQSAPIEYRGELPSPTSTSTAADTPEPPAPQEISAMADEERVEPQIQHQAAASVNPAEAILPPELDGPTHTGVQAPSYAVRGLTDAGVQDLIRTHQAQLVMKARADFFLMAESNGQVNFRRIADLPGYARRALMLRSELSRAATHALRREYGYAEKDIMVLLFPSADLDRLILAKQTLTARQLNIPLTRMRLTEGRLLRDAQTLTFVVERVELQNGTVVSLGDTPRDHIEESR